MDSFGRLTKSEYYTSSLYILSLKFYKLTYSRLPYNPYPKKPKKTHIPQQLIGLSNPELCLVISWPVDSVPQNPRVL